MSHQRSLGLKKYKKIKLSESANLTVHLGYDKHEKSDKKNYRNGYNDKTIKSKGLVNFKSKKGILKYDYTEQKQVFKRYSHFRAQIWVTEKLFLKEVFQL